MSPVRQLIICADMEGASGIFDWNLEAVLHQEVFPEKTLWRTFGRGALTSDVLAVCEAANEAGAEEILLYDGHYAGCAEHNVILEHLPRNVRVFDTPDRCFYWRRIRGQAQWEPWALVTVGQHARWGEENAYFPHTIQTPPIMAFWMNGLHLAEIGTAVLSFQGTPYAANVGCAASHREARELSPAVSCITVKDKARGWEPSPEETFPLIRQGVKEALLEIGQKTPARMEGPCRCLLELTEGYRFRAPEDFPWKGVFRADQAEWEAPTAEIALELFNHVRACITKAQ